MILFVVVLLIVILGLIFMTSIFVSMLLEFLINLPILLFIYYRAKIDLLEKRMEVEYLVAIVLGGAITLLSYPLIKGIPIIWPITIWLVITFIIAKILVKQRTMKQLAHKKRKMHVARRARKPGTLKKI